MHAKMAATVIVNGNLSSNSVPSFSRNANFNPNNGNVNVNDDNNPNNENPKLGLVRLLKVY